MTTITALDEYKETCKLARKKYDKKNNASLMRHTKTKNDAWDEFIKSQDIAQVKLAIAIKAQMEIK